MPEDDESKYFEILKKAVKSAERKDWKALSKQLDLLNEVVEKIITREKKRQR